MGSSGYVAGSGPKLKLDVSKQGTKDAKSKGKIKKDKMSQMSPEEYDKMLGKMKKTKKNTKDGGGRRNFIPKHMLDKKKAAKYVAIVETCGIIGNKKAMKGPQYQEWRGLDEFMHKFGFSYSNSAKGRDMMYLKTNCKMEAEIADNDRLLMPHIRIVQGSQVASGSDPEEWKTLALVDTAKISAKEIQEQLFKEFKINVVTAHSEL